MCVANESSASIKKYNHTQAATADLLRRSGLASLPLKISIVNIYMNLTASQSQQQLLLSLNKSFSIV